MFLHKKSSTINKLWGGEKAKRLKEMAGSSRGESTQQKKADVWKNSASPLFQPLILACSASQLRS